MSDHRLSRLLPHAAAQLGLGPESSHRVAKRGDVTRRDQGAGFAVSNERLSPPAACPGDDDRLAARHGLEGRALPGWLAAVEQRNDDEGGARIDVAELERRMVRAMDEVGM